MIGKMMLLSAVILACLAATAIAADETMLFYLSFDDAEGNIAKDSSVYANDGLLRNNATWAEGKVNGALQLGSGDYVELPEIPEYDVTSAVTVMAWVKTSTVTSWARIIDKSQWQDNGFDLALNMNEHNPLFEFFVNNTTSQVQAQTKVDDNVWHHVAGTFGNKILKIYVDGVLEGESRSVNDVDIKPNDWPIMLGVEANNGSGQPYQGLIDEAVMFNRALSADEVKSIFESGISVSPVTPQAKLPTVWASIKE